VAHLDARTYPPELKERALRLWPSSTPRRPIAHVARELGVNPERLRTPIRQAQADRGERTDRPTTAEIEELRRKNPELRRTGEILKAASAWFVRSQARPGDGHDVGYPAS
jgi:transposase